MVKYLACLLLMSISIIGLRCEKCEYEQFTPAHTLCRFRRSNKNCSIVDRGISLDEVKNIVDQHNAFRSLVSIGATKHPTASNMKQMYWDRELAKIAQRWSEQCRIRHDCNRCRQVERFFVGQNIFSEEHDGEPFRPKWNQVILKWYEQVKKFNSSSILSYEFSSLTGDFSQLIWAHTTSVGCGYTEFEKDGKHKQFYVCNYGPAGNVLTESTYEVGDACSNCNGSCSTNYLGLCDVGKTKKARMMESKGTYEHFKTLASCNSQNVYSQCLISHIGKVKWQKFPGRLPGETAQGAKLGKGMSTDLIVQLEMKESYSGEICVSFWHQKYPLTGDNEMTNQPAKVYIVTSEDEIQTINLVEDSKVWKKVSKSIIWPKNQNIIAVMFHFDLARKRTGRSWRRGRQSSTSGYVTIKLDDVLITSGNC